MSDESLPRPLVAAQARGGREPRPTRRRSRANRTARAPAPNRRPRRLAATPAEPRETPAVRRRRRLRAAADRIDHRRHRHPRLPCARRARRTDPCGASPRLDRRPGDPRLHRARREPVGLHRARRRAGLRAAAAGGDEVLPGMVVRVDTSRRTSDAGRTGDLRNCRQIRGDKRRTRGGADSCRRRARSTQSESPSLPPTAQPRASRTATMLLLQQKKARSRRSDRRQGHLGGHGGALPAIIPTDYSLATIDRGLNSAYFTVAPIQNEARTFVR